MHQIMMALRILLETVAVAEVHLEALKVLTVVVVVEVDMEVAKREPELLAKAITVLSVFGLGIPAAVEARVLRGPLIRHMEAVVLQTIS